mmetsp:Transcript_13424/g.29115  ORF Transcript_13424/g.29115 Transcript_13424/m.29115 type:complete len:163 (+) Transcript_13424:577-1065(+)
MSRFSEAPLRALRLFQASARLHRASVFARPVMHVAVRRAIWWTIGRRTFGNAAFVVPSPLLFATVVCMYARHATRTEWNSACPEHELAHLVIQAHAFSHVATHSSFTKTDLVNIVSKSSCVQLVFRILLARPLHRNPVLVGVLPTFSATTTASTVSAGGKLL